MSAAHVVCRRVRLHVSPQPRVRAPLQYRRQPRAWRCAHRVAVGHHLFFGSSLRGGLYHPTSLVISLEADWKGCFFWYRVAIYYMSSYGKVLNRKTQCLSFSSVPGSEFISEQKIAPKILVGVVEAFTVVSVQS